MIHIIGSGPAGSYAAYLLAKENQDVHVYEDHDIIGSPIQCTGIITGSLESFVPIDDKYLVNKIYKTRKGQCHCRKARKIIP